MVDNVLVEEHENADMRTMMLMVAGYLYGISTYLPEERRGEAQRMASDMERTATRGRTRYIEVLTEEVEQTT